MSHSGNAKSFAKAKCLSPKMFFKRTPSAPVPPAAEVPIEIEIAQYDFKPAWKLLGARKVAREAMSDDHELPLVAETQAAVLSNRLAWKVLAHRRNQRLALSKTTNEERTKDLGCCSKTAWKPSIQDFLAEVERSCAEVEDVSFESASLNTLCCK